MQFCGNASYAAWKNLSGLGSEFPENLRIGRHQLLDRDILTTACHLAVRLAEVDAALDGLWLGHDSLAEFAVKGSAFQEVVKLHFLQAAWSAEAFLVTCGYVTGSRFALGFRFGAFKDNDLAWHDSVVGRRILP